MDTKKLRQKILDLAIHGKLVPQEPNDEPASVLLERIRAEKEQLIKEGKIKAPKKSKTAGDTSHYGKEGPWEVPEGWIWCGFPVVARLISGQDFPPERYNSEANGIPYIIGASNIEYGHLVITRWTGSPSVLSDIGDILVVCKGAGVGKIGINSIGTVHIARQIQAVRIVVEVVLPEYMQMLINWCVPSIVSHANGLIPGLKRELLLGVQLPIPPINEQKRILRLLQSVFTTLDEIEDHQKKLTKGADSTKKIILDLAIHGKLVPQDPSDESAIELLKRINPYFVPSDNLHYEEYLPEGWCTAPLSSFCTTINGLWKGNKEPLVKVGVIRNANFTKDFGLDYSKIEYIDVELKSFEKRNLEDGDIIVEKSGGSDNFPVGRSILFNGNSRKYSFSNFTMSLRILDKGLILPKYLYYALQYKYRRGDMKQMQTQTTGLHNLLTDKFLSSPIPIPPVSEQEKIVEAIEDLFRTVDGIRDLVNEGQ